MGGHGGGQTLFARINSRDARRSVGFSDLKVSLGARRPRPGCEIFCASREMLRMQHALPRAPGLLKSQLLTAMAWVANEWTRYIRELFDASGIILCLLGVRCLNVNFNEQDAQTS